MYLTEPGYVPSTIDPVKTARTADSIYNPPSTPMVAK